MENQTQWNKKSILLWGMILIAACVVYGTGISSESIWYDEAFSAKMTEHSPLEIIHYTMQDNHPPLYYLLLKLARTLLGTSEAALRTLSALAAVLIIALGAGPVRRIFGNRMAYIYTAIALFTPVILIYAHEARMYTLAILSVTAALLYGYLAVQQHKLGDWILFGVATLAAAYLHYYALIAAALTHLYVLIWTFIKEPTQRKIALPISGIALLLYLPWLLPFIKQIMDVKSGFWLGPVSVEMVVCAFYQPFAYKDHFHWPNPEIPLMMHLALFISLALIVTGAIVAFKKRDKSALAFGGMVLFVHLGTLVSAILFSTIVTPIFYARYFLVCAALFVLLISLSIYLLPKRTLQWGAVGLFALLNVFTLSRVYTQHFNHPMKQLAKAFQDKIQPGDLIATADSYSMGPALYYFPEMVHLHIPNSIESQWGHVLDSMRPFFHEAEDRDKLFKEHDTFWHITTNIGPPFLAANIVRSSMKWDAVTQPVVISNPSSYIEFRITKYARNDKNDMTPRGTINVHMTGLRRRGAVFAGLWTSDPIGPTGKPYRIDIVNVDKDELSHSFTNVEYGDYVIAMAHDENKNHNFDMDEDGQPVEGSWLTLPEHMSMEKLQPKDVKMDILKFMFNAPSVSFQGKMFYPVPAK